MTTIDFSRIRSTPKSRNDSFEAIAVQLFRATCKVPPLSSFYSLRGDGGDGGIEAYFRTPGGDVRGIQAKYFFKLGASELGQISSSLKTAMENHLDLTEYWVYVPFDLTGRKSQGTRGKGEVERFEEWKAKVEHEAEANERLLTVVLCSASTIRGQIHQVDKHGGLSRYWFDDTILTDTQVQGCLDQAKAFAGPRYTEGLDVVTNAHHTLDFFGGIGDFEAWREDNLLPLLAGIRSLERRSKGTFNVLPVSEQELAIRLLAQIKSQLSLIRDAADFGAVVETVRGVLRELAPLAQRARALQETAFAAKHGADNDTPGFRQFSAEHQCTFPAGPMDTARETEKSIAALDEVLLSPSVQASTTQSLLLVGPAGAGKTHALVSAAQRRLKKGGYSLVVFGDDFGRAEPWEVLRSKLGFGADVGREALFECLQACADNTNLPFVIAIDALNESPSDARWKDKLPELLQQCKQYQGIKVCVSTRDTYLDLVVDARFPGFAFHHSGFDGREFEALQAFAVFYGLDTEITPLFAAELTNPLFLHLACRTLQEQGKTSIDVSLLGFSSLFESHLVSCDKAVRARLGYSNPRNVVRASMLTLSNVLISADPATRLWTKCVETLRSIVGTELPPETLLRELQHEGLVILTSDDADEWTVRLGYQRYGDVLRAISLLESIIGSSGKTDLSLLQSSIKALTPLDAGLLEVLAAVLPERTGFEITEKVLGLDAEQANRLLVSSLPWRSRESIPSDIEDHINTALQTPNLWQDVFEAFFKLCLVPDHRLNAEVWLHPFLWRHSLTNRDAHLSLAAFKSYDRNGAVKSLIESALRADVSRWPIKSLRLAMLALGWLTSCADRRLRDQATKGLTRVICHRPTLARELLEAFEGCDDDYILESIVLATYTASLLDSGDLAEYIPALDLLVSPSFETPNILVRDTVRLLARKLAVAGVPVELQERLSCYPTRVAAPNPWPTEVDAKPLTSLENLPLNMKLWGESMAPDFWRYEVRPSIENFNLKSAGVTLENAAAWVMTETLNLGYPGYNECALCYDAALTFEYGSGRGRQGYAERLGKKYYWVSLHRLLGVLADNVVAAKDYSGRKPGPDYLWSAIVRKSDPSDVRDLGAEGVYPDEVLQGPRYCFPDQSSDIKAWVLSDDVSSHAACLTRVAVDGTEWVALSLTAKDNDRTEGDDFGRKPFLNIDLVYMSVLSPVSQFPRGLVSKLEVALDNQEPHCYQSYLAEYPEGAVFQQCVEGGDTYLGHGKFRYTEVLLMRGNEWGYDYSAVPIQDSLNVPCQDLVRGLGLVWDKQRGWLDKKGSLAAFESKAKKRTGLFIRRDLLNQYLSIANMELFHRRFANRGLIDQSGEDGCQLDIDTYLRYQTIGAPTMLHEHRKTYGC